MTEEPYRWLEAVENRREYVRTQVAGGSPVLAASLAEGVLVVGVGDGRGKVFEIFDRQALAGLGHPADLEKIRQSVIDMAHIEAFTRAAEDVSLRRLVGYGLGPQLKAHFDQIYAAPYLVELLFAEVGRRLADDVFMRLHFDGTFESVQGRCAMAVAEPAVEAAACAWVAAELGAEAGREQASEVLMQAWGCLMGRKSFTAELPGAGERRALWRELSAGKTLEIGWLDRTERPGARWVPLQRSDVGL